MTDQDKTALLSKLRAPVADELSLEALEHGHRRYELGFAAGWDQCVAIAPVAGDGKTRVPGDHLGGPAVAWDDGAQSDQNRPESRASIESKGGALDPVAGETDDEEATDAWRRLALQFDGHRMQALGHLRAMLADPQAHAERAAEFLAAPPLSGEQVLAERIRALAAPHASKAQPNGYAYRYPSIDGSVIRFNNGGEVNGARPIEAIPYWFGSAPQASEAELKEAAAIARSFGAPDMADALAPAKEGQASEAVPFAPDWANYRQGWADGLAEGNEAIDIARTALMEIADLADVEADQRGVIVNAALTRIDEITSRPALSAQPGAQRTGGSDGQD